MGPKSNDCPYEGKIKRNMTQTEEKKAIWREEEEKAKEEEAEIRVMWLQSDKGPFSQSFDFSSSRVWIWELDHKESWAPKNWCFWTVVLEKTLESSLDGKEIKLVHPKGNQSWIFIGRTNAEAETPILWPPHVKSWLIGKDPDLGEDWRQEEKGMIENKMVGWHH